MSDTSKTSAPPKTVRVRIAVAVDHLAQWGDDRRIREMIKAIIGVTP